jgi:catechol 2,3-dioxygenase-like lactoylglutathione lyase family enzyme
MARILIDHTGLSVRDLEKSMKFYTAALAPLGIRYLYTNREGSAVFGIPRHDDFTLYAADKQFPPTSGAHVAFTASDHGAVRAFFEAAVKAGGRARYPPAVHAEYNPGYYAAYVWDPDGNSIEAVHHVR